MSDDKRMNISDEAVEAAHRAWREQNTEPGTIFFEYNLRAALEAAAPHLMAAAWDEGYGAMVHDAFRDQELVKRGSRLDSDKATRNPYRDAGAGE